ncbi:ShlB/FhaC/HecB family hemolysin secretion/activation protein [Roseateles sp. DC23W]|uniref:ShlB/FhaC/HecB family hemolysin secretion/activation protein n=1 Tax=Pelomonas dachongensis TaxID=3299029 RepID=A0ABW7EJN5_9BURK
MHKTLLHRVALSALLFAGLPQVGTAWAQPVAETRVGVREFRVTGNTLLPQPRIDETLAPFKGERSLAELKAAAAALQALYRDAGYGSVIAYLPQQSGPAGVATIAVLEGRLRRVVVIGHKAVGEAVVRRSLPSLAEGLTPQLQRIDAEVQLANENPARQVAVSLEAGAAPGDVDANVSVTESSPSTWTLGLDNTGNAGTGRLRAHAGYQRAGLWDLDHVLSLQFQTAPEKLDSVRVFSASYRAPLYGAGLMLDAFAAYSDVDGGTTSTVAGPLQFSGKGEVVGVRLGGQLRRSGELVQRLALGLDHRAYINDCAISGLPAGACGSAGESVAVRPLSLDYQMQWAGDVPLALQLTLARGLRLGGRHADAASFNAVRPGALPDYTSLRANGSAQIPLPGQWQVALRGQGQLSSGALVPGEQFGVGGSTAVRGYEEREVSGDAGVLGSLELMGPNLTGGVFTAVEQFRLLGFAEAGQVWNRLGTPCRGLQTRCSVAAVGLGARLGGNGLQVRVDWALALKDGVSTSRHDQRLHLQVAYSFH